MEIIIRKAILSDKDFVTDAIVAAEKSGGNAISYCTIFGISEEKFLEVLSEILDEDMEGQELCISGYLIVEVDGERAAAFCGWIEKGEGMSSNMIRRNLLMHFLGKEIMLNAAGNMKLMGEIDIQRTEYALQVEMSYTIEKFRGLGLYGRLVNEHIRLRQEAGIPFDKVQGIIYKSNLNPYKALSKIGFINVFEKHCANPDILKLLPSDTKILMERKINTL
jgi:hypothetical protein